MTRQRPRRKTLSNFNQGVLWAATFLVNGYDQPMMAAELCREAGLTEHDLRHCDEADQPAVSKILAENPYKLGRREDVRR